MAPSNEITDRDIYRYAAYGMPEFVKAASGEQAVGGPDMAAAHYADPFDNAYPTHTAAATWLSHIKFAETRGDLRPGRAAIVEQNLADAASYFGIGDDVVAAAIKRAAAAAPAGDDTLPDSAFAWISDGARRIRMADEGEVKSAASYLIDHRGAFEYADRARMAGRIIDRAADLGADLGDDREALEKVAGLGGTTAEKAAAAVLVRVNALAADHPEDAAGLRPVAAAAREVGEAGTREGRRKLATLLDEVDRRMGIRLGDSPVGFPEDELFEVTDSTLRKFAAEHIQTTTGAVYRIEDLLDVDLEDLGRDLGEKVASACGDGPFARRDKIAAALPRMGREEAARFELAMKARGVRPVFSKKAAGPRLDVAALLELAGPDRR